MEPVIDDLKKQEKKLNIKVSKIDVDEWRSIRDKYGVMSIPTLVILKDDKELKRFVGVTSKEDIIKVLVGLTN